METVGVQEAISANWKLEPPCFWYVSGRCYIIGFTQRFDLGKQVQESWYIWYFKVITEQILVSLSSKLKLTQVILWRSLFLGCAVSFH